MEIGGTTFRSSAVIVLGVVADLPQFGEVKEVYVVGANRVLLYIRLLDTQHFFHHCHCYVVRRSSSFKVVSPSDMYTHSLLYLRYLTISSSFKLVVVPKYHMCNSLY